jgi:outer membrane murein-binding lipoprotein Lpp
VLLIDRYPVQCDSLSEWVDSNTKQPNAYKRALLKTLRRTTAIILCAIYLHATPSWHAVLLLAAAAAAVLLLATSSSTAQPSPAATRIEVLKSHLDGLAPAQRAAVLQSMLQQDPALYRQLSGYTRTAAAVQTHVSAAAGEPRTCGNPQT